MKQTADIKFRLGYFSACENAVIANMPDTGVYLTAKVCQKDLRRRLTGCLAVEIFFAELVIANPKSIDGMLADNRVIHRTFIDWERYNLKDVNQYDLI